MVRIARQSNTAMLIPERYGDITRAPADLVTAIQHAHTIISWHENLPRDEVPEPWMWPFADEINDWFDEIEEIRRQEREKRSGGGDEWAPMMDGNAWEPGDEL